MSEVNFIIIKPEMPHAAFIELAAAQFPAVAADLLDEAWAGLIHLQVGCLTRYANACLASGDLTEFARLLRFVEQALPKVASDLDNALYVSFLEYLELDGNAPAQQAARKLLPAEFLEFYVAVHNRPNRRPDSPAG